MSSLRRVRALVICDGLPLIWVVLTGLALYPVWRARLLPMLDTPNHLALARGWHDFHDQTSRVAEFYELRVRVVPYYLFYATINLLLYVCSIETANKLFLSAYLVLFPLSVLALSRALGRSPWLALFGFPLAFCQNWIYGFASYLMSVTFALFALAALVAYLDTRKVHYALALGGSCVVSYLGHIMPWVLFGLLAIGTLVLHWRRWQAAVVAAAVMLPSVMMAITALLDEQQDHTYIKDAPFAGTFRDFPTSVLEFWKRVIDLFPGRFCTSVFLTMLVVIIGLIVWQRRGAAPADAQEPRTSQLLKVLIWILALAYLSLPYAITKPMSWWYVAPRIPPLIMVFVALHPNVRIEGRWRLALLPVVVCSIALPIKLAQLYRNFSGRNLPAMRLIEETPRGALTMLVVRHMMRGSGSEEKSGDPVTSGPVYWHFSSWPMALRGGYSPYLFDQGIPLRPKKPLIAPPFGSPDTFSFRQAPQFEYYVIRDASDDMDREPSVKLIHRLGDWSLYKRIHVLTDEP